MDNLTPSRRCVSLDSLPAFIKPRYKRLALISSQGHMDQLAPVDEDTLVVMCDWLLWQESIDAGHHCVYYELGIAEWSEPDTLHLDSDLMLLSNKWIYETGKDITEFRGVSLGKQFHSEMLFCLINYLRLERSLRKLIDRFQPEEILFYDFANDINVLDRSLRREVVQSIIRELGLRFMDRSDPSEHDAYTISENLLAVQGSPSLLRRILLPIYTGVLGFVTALRTGWARKTRVLMLLGGNSAEPLILNFHGGGITPIFQAQTVPKKLAAFWRCLVGGIKLVTLNEVPLSADDQDRLDAIRADLTEMISRPATGRKVFIHNFLKSHFLESGKFKAIAAEVRKAEHLIDTCKPDRIVVDGVRNPPPRIFVELAYGRGIPVDYYWHSPLIPQYLKFDALGGDPDTPPMVDRCLTWGKINDIWLDLVKSRQPRIRVGSPQTDRYRDWSPAPALEVDIDPKTTNVLVLQYAPINSDMKSLNANLYSFFVEMVHALKARGFTNIRFKLHPGPGRWKKSYFQKIADFFEIDCKILKTEPYSECVDWADIVIGPVQTSAFHETLAAGKPYYAILIAPHSYETSCYGDYPVLSSVEEICEALENRTILEKGVVNGEMLLEDLYSTKQFPSGCARFWEVLEKGFSEAE
jgi:hypothetical protein